MRSEQGSDMDEDMHGVRGDVCDGPDNEDLDDEVLLDALLDQAVELGDDSGDEEWVPSRVRYQQERRKREQKGAYSC